MTPRAYALILTIALLSGCRAEPPSMAQPIPVRMAIAARTDFTPALTLLGVVRAAQSVPLTASQRGAITFPSRFAAGLRTGERVSRGETIATIHNDQVTSSQTQARLQMDAAAADFERKKRSHDAGLVSAADFSSAQLTAALAREVYENASREVATLRLVSPANGTLVVTKPLAPGTTVEPSTVLADIVSGGALVIESTAAAADRALLRPSLTVHFTAHGSPPWHGSGHVTEVAAVVDATGTARIVCAIDARSDAPPPGTGVEAQVDLDRHRDVLCVPEDALVAGGDGPALFVAGASEGHRFRVKRVRVETGGRARGLVEITSGLRDGDRVVIGGADGLAEDALVTSDQ
jgi:RND family efflux transporter MFP subunit